MGSSKKKKGANQTVGYSYFLGLQMGVARAINSLVQIRVGDQEAWRGNKSDSGPLYIDAPDLFGGQEGEGGIRGTLDLMLGGPGQVASPALKRMLSGDSNGRVPGFRGFVSAYFDGMYAQFNPYPKRWGFRVRRSTAGWPAPGPWYPERMVIPLGNVDLEKLQNGTITQDELNAFDVIHAMNPAHIILFVLTDPVTGRGLPRSALNLAAFRQAADTLASERLGLCLKWTRENSISDFVQLVLDHIGGAIFQDRTTGLITLKLIRQDYDPNTLPVFTTSSGILAIEQSEVAARPAIVNEIIVQYFNPVDNIEGSVRVQNLGAMQGDGAVYSTTLEYPGLPTSELASKVAQRELRSRSVGLRRFTLKCDRRMFEYQPGDVFKISDTPRGLGETVLRLVDYEDGSINDPTITIIAVQDIYAFPLTQYTDPQPGEHIPRDPTPELARRIVYEVPYVWLRRFLPDPFFSQLDTSSGYMGVGAEQPTGLHTGYYLSVRREGDSTFERDGSGSFVPLGDLARNVDYLDDTIELVNTSLTTLMTPGLSLLINEEVVHVTGVEFEETDLGGRPFPGSNVVLTVERGVSDTRPWRHTTGDTVWFFDDYIGSDYFEYNGGETVEVKVLPWTLAGGAYPEELAPIDELTFDYRFIRPYLPGNVFLNEERWYVPGELLEDQPATVTWAHRDRVLQDDRLLAHQEGNVGPEPGSSYNVTVFDPLGDVVRDVTGISGTSWTYDHATAIQDLGLDGLNIDATRLLSLRLQTQRTVDGIVFDSWQNYEMDLTVRLFKFYVWVAQFARAVAVKDDLPSLDGIYVGQFARAVAVKDDLPSLDGIYVAQTQRLIGQRTAFPKTPDRRVMERPYIDQRRNNVSTAARMLLAVAARPLDLIPEHYDFLTVRNTNPADEDRAPPAPDSTAPWTTDSSEVPFSRWAMTTDPVLYEDTWLNVAYSSQVVGLPIGGVPAGSLIAVNEEIMVVESSSATQIIVKRGSADTIPWQHGIGSYVWFLQTAAASRRAAFSKLYAEGNWVAAKYVQQNFAGPISLDALATDQVKIRGRVDRPYPPGRMRVNGEPWYTGGFVREEGDELLFTWVDRNRITQGSMAVGHQEPRIPREPGTTYRLTFYGPKPRTALPEEKPPVYLETFVDGESYTVPYDLARSWGFRAARAVDGCGSGAVRLEVHAMRDGLESWQGYSIPLRLPAPECPTDGTGNQPSPPWPGDPGGGGGGPVPIPPPPSDNPPSPSPPPPTGDDDTPPPPDFNDPPVDDGQDPEPVDPNLPEDPDEGPQGGKWSRNWGNDWGSDEPWTGDN